MRLYLLLPLLSLVTRPARSGPVAAPRALGPGANLADGYTAFVNKKRKEPTYEVRGLSRSVYDKGLLDGSDVYTTCFAGMNFHGCQCTSCKDAFATSFKALGSDWHWQSFMPIGEVSRERHAVYGVRCAACVILLRLY